ncbi:MAG: MarR family transcriptional regulator [Acidimicrobiales bacterium]|nr:MarR family transcriptional regulator [Acidimicrobiales bacterium]
MADPTTFALLLGRLGRLNEAMVAEICADHDTTPAEVRVMSLLIHRPGRSASPSDIARFVVQTSGGLTATLRRLESDGFVERRPDPADGRGKLVVLTVAGVAFHGRVIDAITTGLERIVRDIPLADASEIVRSLVVAFEADTGLPSSADFRAGVAVPTEPAPV